MESQVKTVEIVESNKLCEIKIQRVPEGLSIYVKSKIIEDFMKAVSNGEKRLQDNSDRPFYSETYYCTDIPHIQGKYKSGIGAGGYTIDGSLDNVSFLKTVGISEGKTFIVKALILGDKRDVFAYNIKEYVKQLYLNCIKDVKIEITMNII